MTKLREITYAEAIAEAISQSMEKDPSVFIIGEGVPDPKAIFGTTKGLVEKYGSDRVLDMPVSENALTGVCIGTALRGMRPIMVHQRLDFVLLAMDQIVNNSAKWHYMFGGQTSVPFVVRAVIGMGWGQGAQHSQNIQAIFTHIPGLKVVMPATPYDAKGLLISSIQDNNPVIFIEHRWLHHIRGHVPTEVYNVPIGKAEIIKGSENYVHSVSRSFVIPSIIRLLTFVSISRKLNIQLSKQNIIRRDNGVCQYCGKTNGKMTVDHVVPKSQGGGETWENLVCACPECNNLKGHRSLAEAGMTLIRKPKRPSLNSILFPQRLLVNNTWYPYLN